MQACPLVGVAELSYFKIRERISSSKLRSHRKELNFWILLRRIPEAAAGFPAALEFLSHCDVRGIRYDLSISGRKILLCRLQIFWQARQKARSDFSYVVWSVVTSAYSLSNRIPAPFLKSLSVAKLEQFSCPKMHNQFSTSFWIQQQRISHANKLPTRAFMTNVFIPLATVVNSRAVEFSRNNFPPCSKH